MASDHLLTYGDESSSLVATPAGLSESVASALISHLMRSKMGAVITQCSVVFMTQRSLETVSVRDM